MIADLVGLNAQSIREYCSHALFVVDQRYFVKSPMLAACRDFQMASNSISNLWNEHFVCYQVIEIDLHLDFDESTLFARKKAVAAAVKDLAASSVFAVAVVVHSILV